MKKPLVSVIMPIYNSERYMDISIKSVLNQTFRNFELILINDCSKDGTWRKMLGWKKKDPRIVLVDNTKNMGVAETFNTGVRKSLGGYVVRMDSDDIAEPTKLEAQVDYLNTHKNIAILGTWANVVDEHYNCIDHLMPPITHKVIEKKKFIETIAINPSIMIRRDVFDKIGMCDPTLKTSEDYDFFMRAMQAGYKIENIPKFLLNYMRRSEGLTISKNRDMLKNTLLIRLKYIGRNLSIRNILGTTITFFRFLFASTLTFYLTNKIKKIYKKVLHN